MHLRRALLLFAIVLGLAAAATGLSQPHRQERTGPEGAPASPAQPRPAPSASPLGVVRASFEVGAHPQTRRVVAGHAAEVSVSTSASGQVQLAGLGMTAPADRFTPARFEVLSAHPGRYEVRFTPAAALTSQPVGTLVVEPAS
jgi:hypothetical protein